MKSALRALIFVAALFGAAFAEDFPSSTGYVTDTVNILTPEQRADVEAELRNYEKQTGTEIAVLLVKNTGGREVADYATAVANKWGVGKKGVDNGALLVVSMDTHKIFIAVGRQLEGAVTDSQAGAISRNVIKPRFKEGNFYAGIKNGVLAIEKVIAGETFTDKRSGPKEKSFNDVQLIEALFFLGVVAISWLAAILGRTKAIWPGGALGAVIGAGIAWFLAYNLMMIIIVGALAGAAGLAFDWFVSKNYDNFTRGGPTPPWWMGGGGFGGGSFSGGGGGSDW